MDKPFLSIVTVTRNAALLLLKTIRNVETLDSQDIEYIVVDGASTDNSHSVIADSHCIDKWISEPDKGIYDAMNKGARMAQGEWIIFMNAGDTFASGNVVSRLKEYALSHPEGDVIYGDVIRSGDSPENDILKTASDTLKGHRLAFCHQSVICKREDLLETPFDISHKYSADFKFFKTLEKKGKKFHHINIPVARFDTSGISTQKRSKGLADNMKVIAETDGIIRGLPSILHLFPTYFISRLKGK